MTDWRPVRSLAERECDTCQHGWDYTSRSGVRHRFCRQPTVLETMERKLVAAGLARDEVCSGKHWKGAR